MVNLPYLLPIFKDFHHYRTLNSSVEGTQYHLTAYADDGRVLSTEEGFVEVILPKQMLGVGGDMFTPEEETISRVDTCLTT